MNFTDDVLLILFLSILTSPEGDIANDSNFLLLILLILSLNGNSNTGCNSCNRFRLSCNNGF